MKNELDLQLLVCSANLGNACPDVESLNHWIPTDGNCLEVFRNNTNSQNNNSGSQKSKQQQPSHKYPIRKRTDIPSTYNGSGLIQNSQQKNVVKNRIYELEKRRQNSNDSFDIEDDYEQYNELDQFDIIVIGMQEATFDPPSNKMMRKDSMTMSSGTNNNSSMNNNNNNKKSLENVKQLSSISSSTNDNNQESDNGSTTDDPNTNTNNTNLPPRGVSQNLNNKIFNATKGAALTTVSAAKTTVTVAGKGAAIAGKGAAIPLKQVKALQGLAGPSRDHTPKMNNHNKPFISSSSTISRNDSNSLKQHSSHNNNHKLQCSGTSSYNMESNSFHNENNINNNAYYKNEMDDSNHRIITNTMKHVITKPITAPLNVLKYASSTLNSSTDWLDGTPILHTMLDTRLSSYQRIM